MTMRDTMKVLFLILSLLTLLGCETVESQFDITGNTILDEEVEENITEEEPEIFEKKVTISPTEGEDYKIYKPGYDKEPVINITKKDEEPKPEFVLSEEYMAKIKEEPISANNRVIMIDAFLKLAPNQKYALGMGVKNPYPKKRIFGIVPVKIKAEEKIGNSFVEIRRDLKVKSWMKNLDEIRNFEIDKNKLEIKQINIQAGPTIKTDREVRPGDRVTYEFEIWLLDSFGKQVDLYSKKTIVLRIV